MSEHILRRVLDGTVPLEQLFEWVMVEINLHGAPKELHDIVNDGTEVSADDFVLHVLSRLREETQWLFEKKVVTPKTQKQQECTSSCSIANLSLDDSKSVSHLNSTEETTPPIELVNSFNDSPRSSSKLKLFINPSSPDSTDSFSASTPKRISASSPFDTSSSKDWERVFPAYSPISTKSHRKNVSADNWNKPKARQQKFNQSLNDDGKNKHKNRLTLGDFIQISTVSSQKKGRRIKPTNISTCSSEKVSVFSQAPEVDYNQRRDSEERILLKRECNIMKETFTKNSKGTLPASAGIMTDVSLGTISTKSASSSSQNVCLLPVDPRLATKKGEIDILSKIYAFILRKNLCSNLMSELYFVTSLLAITEEMTDGAEALLSTSSNCVYFAASVLSQLFDILRLLSLSTMTLLCSNNNVLQFSRSLHERLQQLEKSKRMKENIDVAILQEGNVAFQCDTDSAENFTKHSNFSAFRKQRDGFYHLLREWEKKSNISGWQNKVRFIIASCEDPTNMIHLARLFRSQLLTSCSTVGSSLEDTSDQLLLLLPSADKGKLSRLEARLTGSGPRRGPVPPPDFPGRQLFFRDFIQTCGPGLFLHFLQLSFADELLRLNDIEFSDESNDVEEVLQKRFLETVSHCCLLAKFLSVIEAQPYRGCSSYAANIIELHCSLRQRTNSLFDSEQCLLDAWNNQRLTLTIPWLVNYLSLMDKTTAKLPSSQRLWPLLRSLHKALLPEINPRGRFMLNLCLGWLFQVTVCSEGSKYIALPERECHLTTSCLDQLDLISDACLYKVCPFLMEINSILIDNVTPSRSRHVRPTPQAETSKTENSLGKYLELRLEECFLQNQSSSTRKTIQFVSERVASSCIKFILSDVSPKIRKDVLETTRKNKSDFFSGLSPTENLKMLSEVENIVKHWEKRIKNESTTKGLEFCTKRVQEALGALFGCDINPTVFKTCCELTTRQTMEKVEGWLRTTVLTDICRTERCEEIEAIVTNGDKKNIATPPSPSNPNVDTILILSDVILELRNLTLKASKGTLEDDELQVVLLRIKENLTQGNQVAERLLYLAVSDLLILSSLCCRIKASSSELLLDLMLCLDSVGDYSSSPLSRIICSRNLAIASNSGNFSGIISLFKLLLDSKVLSREQILEQINLNKLDLKKANQLGTLLELMRRQNLLEPDDKVD